MNNNNSKNFNLHIPTGRTRRNSSPNYLPKETVLGTPRSINGRFNIGFAHTPGRKVDEFGNPVMEDILFLENSFRDKNDEHLFLVLDGHNGCEAALLVGKKFESILKEKLRLVESLKENEIKKLSVDLGVEVTPKVLETDQLKVVVALHLSFETVKEDLKYQFSHKGLAAGTTALVCLIQGNNLFVTNVGDTRAVLIDRDGNPEQLSVDHKPVKEEKDRIEASGGTVTSISVPRVEGILAVSRALGNFDLEDKGITWKPHTRVLPSFLDNSSFIILASDGLWDTIGPREAAEIVEEALYTNPNQKDDEEEFFEMDDGPTKRSGKKGNRDNSKEMEACQKLVEGSFAKHCVDNIGIILINFFP